MSGSDSAWRFIQEFLKEVQPYQDVITIIGLLYGTKFAVQFTRNIYNGIKTFIWPLIAADIDFVNSYGSWAVITGATDGIGKEYARELARRKMNIMLISRNNEKLEKTAKEIENEFMVTTHVVQVDFGDGKDIYPVIFKNVIDKDIGILVNNVGIMITPPKPFEKLTEKQIWDYININVAAATMMTHTILPQMISKRKGAIINISSCSAINPLPLQNVYSATKIFVEYFSKCLDFECRKKGITVQTVVPSYVATSLVASSKLLSYGSFLSPKPSKFVRSAVRTLGRSNHTTGYWSHGIQYLFYNSLPQCVFMHGGVIMNKILFRY